MVGGGGFGGRFRILLLLIPFSFLLFAMSSGAAGTAFVPVWAAPVPTDLPLPVTTEANTAVQGPTQDYVPGELVVKFKSQTGMAAATDVATRASATGVKVTLLPDYGVVSVPLDQDLTQVADAVGMTVGVPVGVIVGVLVDVEVGDAVNVEVAAVVAVDEGVYVGV